MRFFFSVDLGTMHDYTAVSILERRPVAKQKQSLPETPAYIEERQTYTAVYKLWHLERFPLGMDYPAIVDRLVGMMRHNKLEGQTAMIVDSTGPGLPVFQMIQGSGLKPIGINITSGSIVTKGKEYMFNVPKGDLVSSLNLVFQSRRIKIPVGLKLKAEFLKELERFEVTLKKTGTTYEAAVASIHDDLVLSVAMGCWYAERTEGREYHFPGSSRTAKHVEEPLREFLK